MDITLVDQNGVDVLQSVGVNVDLAATTDVAIVYSGTSVHPTVDDADTLTLKIANNAVVSAELVVNVYYALGV